MIPPGVGVSAAPRSLPEESRLGYLAGDRAQAAVRSVHLRALALLEGVRHWRGRRPAGAPDQRDDVHGGYQHPAHAGERGRRDPTLERRPQYARRPCCRVRLRRPASVHAAEPGNRDAEMYRIQGSKGLLEVTGSSLSYTPQSGKDQYPSYYTGSYPRALRDAYLTKWHQDNDPKMGQQVMMPETISFSGPDFDDVRPHLWTYFEAVRTRKPVVEDVVFGHHAALACHMANESYFRKTSVSWDEASKSIKS